MLFVMKQNVEPNPIQIGFDGALGITPRHHIFPDVIQKRRGHFLLPNNCLNKQWFSLSKKSTN